MINFEAELKKLNSEQKLAVDTIQGPVLVVAGPGTGKTQMLALRIANILRTTDTKPSNILCLTFTESGVWAMRERLFRIIGTDAYFVRIHTFHSFCNEIIQTFPEKFAFARELNQLDDLTKLKIFREILDDLAQKSDGKEKLKLVPFSNKYMFLNDISSSIQTLKREGITPDELKEKAEVKLSELEANQKINKRTGKPTADWLRERDQTTKNFELFEIYNAYNQKLVENGLYDYEDMILFVIKRFEEDDQLLAFYQEKFLYVLVDEFQDTNGAQNKILKLLGSFDKSPNIFAVGDDDQAIYRFQGANVGNLIDFKNSFEDVKTITVTTNYRSSQLILDLSSNLIKHNTLRLSNIDTSLNKNLTAGNAIPNKKTEVHSFKDSRSENEFIAKKILELNSTGVKFSDIAVLYRNHKDSEDLIDVLLSEKVPIRLAAGRNSLDEKLIDNFITLLKVVQYTDSDRDFLLFKVLFFDFLKFERIDIFKIVNFAHENKESIFNILLDGVKLEKLGINNIVNISVLQNFASKIIDWKADSENLSFAAFIQKIMSESGFLDYVFGSEPSNIEDINSVNSFYDYIKSINRVNKLLSLESFLNDINLLKENKLQVSEKELDVDKDGVNLMTAHKSKGLEFKHVFIMKFTEKSWGGKGRSKIIKLPLQTADVTDEVSNLEDERRLLFVATTRAKEHLYFTYASEYPSGNTTTETGPSIFMSELDEKLIEKFNVENEEFNIEPVKKLLSTKLGSPYNIEETEFLKHVIAKFKLSASSLNEYIECPLKFKYNRLLKVPHAKDKTLSMGTAIHFVMEHFYKNLKLGELKAKDYFIYQFEWALKKELLGKAEYEETLKEGTRIISEYYDYYEGTFLKPAEVEYGFYGRNILLEKDGIEPILLTGKIDRVEYLNTNQSLNSLDIDTRVKIVDYKTSSPKSKNDIMGKTKYSTGSIYRQLVFYKLLAEIDNFFRPSTNFPKYKVEQVEVDFIKPDSGKFKREVFEIPNEDVESLKETIFGIMTRIRNLEFGGTDEYPLCEECEYCKMLS